MSPGGPGGSHAIREYAVVRLSLRFGLQAWRWLEQGERPSVQVNSHGPQRLAPPALPDPGQ